MADGGDGGQYWGGEAAGQKPRGEGAGGGDEKLEEEAEEAKHKQGCVFYCHSKNSLDFLSVWSILVGETS